MAQLQALHFAQSVFDLYYNSKDQEKLKSLIQNLVRFDVSGLNTSRQKTMPEIPERAFIAVVNKIITRGFPSLCSTYIEKEISEALKTSEEKEENGSIIFPFSPKFSLEEEELFEMSHIIDPTLQLNRKKYNTNLLGSTFEEDIVFNYMDNEFAFLKQILQPQRKISTIVQPEVASDFKNQRVDFSLESPYLYQNKTKNNFGDDITILERKGTILEIDGSQHNSGIQKILDNQRDNQSLNAKWTTFRVSSNNKEDDTYAFLEKVSQADFIKTYKKNYDKGWGNADYRKRLQHIFTPLAVARLSKTILEIITQQQGLCFSMSHWKIAVLERDVPCANLAIADLKNHFENLWGLAGKKQTFPEVDLTIYANESFFDSELHHKYSNVKPISDFTPENSEQFNLVLDLSIFRRSFVEKPICKADNFFQIRSSHYIHHLEPYNLKTANNIIYKPCFDVETSQEYNNRSYEIEEQNKRLEFFLQNIFRKTSLRVGQNPILNNAIQSKTVIGLLPTGGGKSMTYQLAAMLQPGIVIVVDPIKSLMQDQYVGLIEKGISNCNFINSSLTTTERKVAISQFVNGQIQFSFISPERFLIEEFRDSLVQMSIDGRSIAYCVIDEVHCVSEWGHDFRTSYLRLGENIRNFCKKEDKKPSPLFGLTATASFDVLSDVERELLGNTAAGIGDIIRLDGESMKRKELRYCIEEIKIDSSNYPSNTIPQTFWGIRNFVAETKAERAIKIIDEIPRRFERENNVVEHEKKMLDYNRNVPFFDNECTHGGIIFCPHRKGGFGVTDRYKQLMENGKYVYYESRVQFIAAPDRNAIADRIERAFPQIKVGTFMGSGDDRLHPQIQELIDKESIENQKNFVASKLHLMVATKAFGMGIDKRNVRFTIHINIPNSIESFVQEVGRGGRDQKAAVGFVLLNQDKMLHLEKNLLLKIMQEEQIEDKKLANLGDKYFFKHTLESALTNLGYGQLFNNIYRKIEDNATSVDRDILEFFHKNSFKGIDKEKATLFELRNQIHWPLSNNIDQITQYVASKIGEAELCMNVWAKDYKCRLYINNQDGDYGYIDLRNNFRHYYRYATFPSSDCNDVYEHIMNFINRHWSQQQNIEEWLSAGNHLKSTPGIEQQLLKDDLKIGQSIEVLVPFQNAFIKTEHYIRHISNFFTKNYSHLGLNFNDQQYLDIFSNFYDNSDLKSDLEKLSKKIGKGISLYHDMEGKNLLNRFKTYYYSPRGKADTDKAIHRLVTIGMIDDYTVDYVAKVYKVIAIKKKPTDYADSLHQYIRKFYSETRALDEIEKVKAEIKIQGPSYIGKICLDFLIDFVYKEIEEKRRVAVNDMLLACNEYLSAASDGSQAMSEFMDLYFNSKYARDNYTIDGAHYSLLRDTSKEADTLYDWGILNKYLNVIEIDNGSEVDNLKHLRGGCIRILSSNPEHPTLLLLRAFSQIVLSGTNTESVSQINQQLFDDGSNSLADGFRLYYKYYVIDRKWELVKFDQKISDYINHVVSYFKNEEVRAEVEDILNEIYITTHINWLIDFNQKFLVDYE